MHFAATISHNMASSILAVQRTDMRFCFPISPTAQSISMYLVG
jgi:hypothetical protein